jgi:hypothetical protein
MQLYHGPYKFNEPSGSIGRRTKFMLCAAATACRHVADGSLPTAAESGERFVRDGQFPSADGSRYNKFATKLSWKP